MNENRIDTADRVIRLDDSLDRDLIRRVFNQRGRVHVPGILQRASAQWIHSTLRDNTPWQLAANIRQRHFDIGLEQLALLPPDKRELMASVMTEQARGGFQYAYQNYPIYDLYQSGERDHPLMRVYDFLNSAEFLGFARAATGFEQIAYADAQATLYLPGHQLTVHDDDVAGKNRLVAYVLNLTERWRPDWGGILQFIDDDGHVAEGYTPAFNALNLLRVPQKHCVSFVTPAGASGRYSITGWLRAR